jgi:hypothetical protein
MAMKLTYPDGAVEFLPRAVRVDTQNFHEGMFDFYSEDGNLLAQIDMGTGVKWEEVPEPVEPPLRVDGKPEG